MAVTFDRGQPGGGRKAGLGIPGVSVDRGNFRGDSHAPPEAGGGAGDVFRGIKNTGSEHCQIYD